MACHDRAAADDCPPQQPMSFPLAGKGSSTNVDYKKAYLDANTALDGDFLKQKLAVEKANACPEKCSFPDFYTDPANPPRNETVKPSGRVKATEWRDGHTVDATINTGLFRTRYKTAAEQKLAATQEKPHKGRKKKRRQRRQRKLPVADRSRVGKRSCSRGASSRPSYGKPLFTPLALARHHRT
ncbi:MAG TPA: hypothetical protein VEQ86_12425 [Xanthobacteraceae bacterium]|nr:hypothetical protein [Xanthobacteraceae bacterium]